MINCLICGCGAQFRYEVSAEREQRALAALYADPAALTIEMPDYRMFRCPACELEFADPPIPGTAQFYDWIVAHAAYYPSEGWEWGVVRKLVSSIPTARTGPLV